MRQAFIETLCAIADAQPEIVLLTGDMGFSVLEKFGERFCGRLINTGVAEQNMMGMAAGLAACGKIVLTYSIANFAFLRCVEQFRNDVCYHDLPVIAVSVGAGMDYGAQGYTHHGVEDAALSRLLPHVAVATPGDAAEARWALTQLVKRRRPALLRLGRGGEPVVHDTDPTSPIEKSLILRNPGADATIIACGTVLAEATKALLQLQAQGLDAGLISMPFLQPVDHEAIENAARSSRMVLTVEEHQRCGALGGLVAEVMAGMTGHRGRLVRAGLDGPPLPYATTQEDARAHFGFDAVGLVARVIAECEAA